MFTYLKRLLKFGWQGCCRAKGLSFQVILIMAIVVFVFSCFFFAEKIGAVLIEEVQKKIDIAVYFKKGIAQEDVLKVQDELSQLSYQIESIDYISEDEAIQKFIQAHQKDDLYLRALEELESNPLLSSLNIKAKEPEQYAQISNFLGKEDFKDLIDHTSYNKNKQVIDKTFFLISSIKTAGFALGLALFVIVFLITFNAIKLTVLLRQDEIATMRLVGASNWFIKGPFLVQGLIYALSSVLLVNLLLLLGFVFFNYQITAWLGIDFLQYFKQNALLILTVQTFGALSMSFLSIVFALRKHLKV